MEQKFWSPTQLGITDGALKALAKNVAVHMSLSRTTLKRLVAKVVAERHGLGQIGDYHGHLFYVKPDRIDMTELISQAKEAMDEMLHLNEERERGCGKHIKRRGYRSALRPAPKQFKLEAAGRSSLSGVIIDETHLPRGGESKIIEVQLPRSKQQRHWVSNFKSKSPPKCVQQIKLKKQQNAVLTPALAASPESPAGRKLHQLKPVSRQPQPLRRPPQQLRRQPSLKKVKSKLCRKKAKSPTNVLQAAIDMADLCTATAAPTATAAATVAATAAAPVTATVKEKVSRKDKRLRAGGEHKKLSQIRLGNFGEPHKGKQLYPNPRRAYDKPWLCYRNRRRQKRESAGNEPPTFWQLEQDRLQQELQMKCSRNVGGRLSNVKRHWYTPNQFQGVVGAKQAPEPAQLRNRTRGRNNVQANTNSHGDRVNSAVINRRKRHKLLDNRLIKDVQREEAINEMNQQLDAIWKLHETNSQQQKVTKRRSRRRKVSSRINRLAMSTRAIPNLSAQRVHASASPIKTKSRRFKRSAYVAVDSSLGSIEAMRPPQIQNGTSLLTPAKRHLTIAFMDKRHEETRNPRCFIPWK